jgi:hypothetical protein
VRVTTTQNKTWPTRLTVRLLLLSVLLGASVLAGEIEIRKADYGLRAVYCDASQAIASRCNGQSRCEVEVNAGNLCPDGQDPVPGTVKKLTVKYSCGEGVVTLNSRGENLVRIACQGASAGYESIEVEEFVGRTLVAPASENPDCVREDLRMITTDDADHTASCWELCANLPASTEIQRVDGWSKKANTMKRKYRPCGNVVGSCNEPTESFNNSYRVDSTPSGQRVCWTFRNWSTLMDRDAKMVVYYGPVPD